MAILASEYEQLLDVLARAKRCRLRSRLTGEEKRQIQARVQGHLIQIVPRSQHTPQPQDQDEKEEGNLSENRQDASEDKESMQA